MTQSVTITRMTYERNKGKTCPGRECGRPAKTRGLCPAHYSRLRNGNADYLAPVRHGADGPPRRPLEERFWENVSKSDGCWEWTGSANELGYGHLNIGGHKTKHLKAHRVSWELHNGPIPEGMVVCHRCDHPPCVNPAHLFLGTQADNLRDAKAKLRNAHGETHGFATITEDTVRHIRELRADGMTYREISQAVGASSQIVGQVLGGYSWRHVT